MSDEALERLLNDPRFIESERLADEAIARGDFGLSGTISTLRIRYVRSSEDHPHNTTQGEHG